MLTYFFNTVAKQSLDLVHSVDDKIILCQNNDLTIPYFWNQRYHPLSAYKDLNITGCI